MIVEENCPRLGARINPTPNTNQPDSEHERVAARTTSQTLTRTITIISNKRPLIFLVERNGTPDDKYDPIVR